MSEPLDLLPCPLCEGKARDKGHGIQCSICGLWLGDGTQAARKGGRASLWNRRAPSPVGTAPLDPIWEIASLKDAAKKAQRFSDLLINQEPSRELHLLSLQLENIAGSLKEWPAILPPLESRGEPGDAR